MNVIFLTMSRITDISKRSIYTDLMRKFRDEGHHVYIVSPRERSTGQKTELLESNGVYIIGVRTLNLQKTNAIEKGVGQVLVERQYKRAIKRFINDIEFDLVLYSTPPITFPKVIKYLRKNNVRAKTYLLLKDIFPQNAIDIGMLSETGIRGVLCKYFRYKEKLLYSLSDYIGCMSKANVEYVLKHNPEIGNNRVEVAPNSIEIPSKCLTDDYEFESRERKFYIRSKYGLPKDIPVFIYGGNLGKPQGIDFLIKCIDANKYRKDCFFLIIGNGTEYNKLDNWYKENCNCSVKLMQHLPKEEYDVLIGSCDVGLIFLDYRFSIPNFPSRLLSYLENKMPVLCATDPNTDMGRIAEVNGFGYCCESNSIESFTSILDKMILSDRKTMGEKGYFFLMNNYLVDNTYSVIVKHV